LQGLETLLDGLQKQIVALNKVLEIPTDHWNVLIIHIISIQISPNNKTSLGSWKFCQWST